MGWYVEYCDRNGRDWQSPLSDTREFATRHACDLIRQQHHDVHRVIGPNGEVVEREEIERCYQELLTTGRLYNRMS
jgi:hypothetical protein